MPTLDLRVLLDAAQAEGLVSPRAAVHAHALTELGLHPEQALIGTRLVSPDEYAALASGQFGGSIERLPPKVVPLQDETFPTGWLASRNACVLRRSRHGLVLACPEMSERDLEDARRHALAEGKALETVPVLLSETRRTGTAASPKGGVRPFLRRVLEVAHFADANAVRFVPHREGVQVIFHTEDVAPPSFFAPLGWISALAHVATHVPGWRAELAPGSFGHSITLLPATSAHTVPSHAESWNAFVRDPEGLFVVIAASPRLRRTLAGEFPLVQDAERDQGVRALVLSNPSAEEEERAFHRALAGHPTVLVTPGVTDGFEGLDGSAVPIRVCEATSTRDGVSWKVRACS